MQGVDCEDIHWRLVDLGIDHACGLVSLLRVIGARFGITALPDVVDVIVSHDADYVREALGGSVVVERSLVPNLLSRAVLIGGVPYASLEDLVVSVVVNDGLPWYIDLVREVLNTVSVRENLRWEWVNEVLNRYGVREKFVRLTAP